MIKFESENRNLEIVRCGTFSWGYLNRQVITLLSCNGVKDEIFLRKLNLSKKASKTTQICKSLIKR